MEEKNSQGPASSVRWDSSYAGRWCWPLSQLVPDGADLNSMEN
jgi:hypothetical protein